MIQLLKNIKNLRVIAARYFLYGFGVIDILLLPKLLDEQIYADFEYAKNLVYLFPNVLLGASSGFIFEYYTNKTNNYKKFFTSSIIITVVVTTIICLLTSRFLFALPLIAINFYTIVEQYLKISRQFVLAFFFKPLISIFTVLYSYILFKRDVTPNSDTLLFISFLLAVLVWSLFLINKKSVQFFSSLRQSFNLFIVLVKKSYSITLASLVLSILFFSERFFVEKFYGDYLPTYSFAFNISQVAVVLFSVINYIKTIEIGEQFETIKRKELLLSFSSIVKVYLIFFFLYVIGVVTLSKFYDFTSLITITLIISYAKGFNVIVGTVSPIAMFKNYNLEMLKTIILLFLGDLIISIVLCILQTSLIYILVINSIILLIYSFYILNIVFRRISYVDE